MSWLVSLFVVLTFAGAFAGVIPVSWLVSSFVVLPVFFTSMCVYLVSTTYDDPFNTKDRSIDVPVHGMAWFEGLTPAVRELVRCRRKKDTERGREQGRDRGRALFCF